MLYEKIKNLAREKGVSIYSLEKQLDISSASLCKWNNIEPSVAKVKKVAEYFGVSIDYLMDGITYPDKKNKEN